MGHLNRRRTILQATVALGASVALLATACGTCSSAAQADSLQPRIAEVTPSAIRLTWPAVRGAEEVRVLVAPEPRRDQNGRLLGAKRVATLDGDADGYRLEDLPPGTQVFLRLEADTARGMHAVNLQTRTKTEGEAPLDSPVVEVNGFAPKVLRVVLRDGNSRVWGRDGWEVRRSDGSEIPVRNVHLHSVPVGQPGYEIGFGADDDLAQVEVDHRVFLELGEPIGSREVLTLEGPNDLEVLVPFSDCFTETPVVQLNQVGYNPRATARWAYVSGFMGDGGGLDLDDFPSELELRRDPGNATRPLVDGVALRLTQRSPFDEDTGAPVKQIDLTDVPVDEEAVYRIRIPGVGVSYPTRVSERGAFEAFYVVTRGLFHNRWGGDLRAPYTDWVRPADHPHVYTADQQNAFEFFARGTPKRGRRALAGGYHDAGDFDQRPMHTVVPQVLMRAFELSPDRFTDGQLTLPESGNGIPDLLDEALWGVRAWEQLQEQDGGVRAGVESTRHPWGIYLAHQDELDYFTYARDPQVTARAAGLFAQAARLVEPFDQNRARALRRRAERAWRWAEGRDVRPAFALYALGELHRLTGEEDYAQAFQRVWTSIGPYGAFSNFTNRHNFQGDYMRNGQVMPDYILGYLGSSSPDQAIVELSNRWISQYADEAGRSILSSSRAHRNARPAGRPQAWGQGTVMGRYLDPIFARLALGGLDERRRQAYFDAISVAADYVLGANPLGMVFITGLGTESPEEPLHLDSLVFAKRGEGPMPGIPVYGPVEDLPRAEYYRYGKAAFHPRFEELPPGLRYADIRSFVVTNECTIWECQAPHAEHFAVLLGDGFERPPEALLPEGAQRGR